MGKIVFNSETYEIIEDTRTEEERLEEQSWLNPPGTIKVDYDWMKKHFDL